MEAAFTRFRPSGPGLAVRLARPPDLAAIAAIEAEAFNAQRAGPQRLGPEYHPGLWCENRLGPVLRVVAEDARGITAYGLAQIRRNEVYVFEIAARGGGGAPGHDIFFTLTAVAQRLGRPVMAAILSRPDRRAALLRLYASVGVRPAARRGFALNGAPPAAADLWLEGPVAEILSIAPQHQTGKDADHG